MFTRLLLHTGWQGSGICLCVVKELWCVVIQLSFMCCNITVVTEEGYFFYRSF